MALNDIKYNQICIQFLLHIIYIWHLQSFKIYFQKLDANWAGNLSWAISLCWKDWYISYNKKVTEPLTFCVNDILRCKK